MPPMLPPMGGDPDFMTEGPLEGFDPNEALAMLAKSKVEKLKQKLVSMTLKEEPFEETDLDEEPVPVKKPKAPPPPPAPKPRPVREKPAPRPSSPGLIFV